VEQSPMQPISRPSLDQFSDEELTALALAADTGAAIDPDAVAWDGALLHQSGLLPDWYMPTPVGRRIGRWPRTVVIGLTIGFLIINAAGLCITSGFVSLS
jgi:hypothetical protein